MVEEEDHTQIILNRRLQQLIPIHMVAVQEVAILIAAVATKEVAVAGTRIEEVVAVMAVEIKVCFVFFYKRVLLVENTMAVFKNKFIFRNSTKSVICLVSYSYKI